MKFGKLLLLLFVVLGVINLVAESLDLKPAIFLTKPLLIATLAAWFFLATKAKRSFFSKMILGALIFSMGGDTLLMFVENDVRQHFFLLGLVSFLIAHLFYIIAFGNYPSGKKGLVQDRKGWGIPFVLYFIGVSCYLLPDIPGDMKGPVVVYSAVIISMLIVALNTHGKVPAPVSRMLFTGALFFVISDTFIALNKFKTAQLAIPQPGLIIMSTYLLGQFLIVRACSKMNDLIPGDN